mgnify:CR=1 FL=1
MSKNAKKSLLFMQTPQSIFDYKSELFESGFSSVTFASDEQKVLKLIYKNSYDFIVCDLSANIDDGIVFVKQLKKLKPEANLYTFVKEEDEEKIGGFIDMGIHTFVLNAQQFEQALETIAEF